MLKHLIKAGASKPNCTTDKTQCFKFYQNKNMQTAKKNYHIINGKARAH